MGGIEANVNPIKIRGPSHHVVHRDLVLTVVHVLTELWVDVGEGVARVGRLGGGGARRVRLRLALDGVEVGQQREGILVSLLGLGLHTDRHLLEGGLLLRTGLGVIIIIGNPSGRSLPYTSSCRIISHSGGL